MWQPRRTPLEVAEQRLTNTLERLGNRLSEAYGRPYDVRCATTGLAVVGTIGYDSTVSSATGWIGDDQAGAAFAGVVEGEVARDGESRDTSTALADLHVVRAGLLGRGGPAARTALHAALSLPGRWSAATWLPGLIAVVNGAATGRSLWLADGPDGCAVGSQARHLLYLVGRSAQLDLDRAALSVQLGYVAGGGSLYEGVRRVGSGMRVVMRSGEPPQMDRPIVLDEILGPRAARAEDDAIDEFAGRVTGLVSGELAVSGDVRIGLSGGRDSRLLAAAAVAGGLRPRTTTGGPAASPDVVLARRVAELLGLDHAADAYPASGSGSDQDALRRQAGGLGRSQPMTIARLAAWVSLSDGTAPASLAWVARDMSQPVSMSSRPTGQTLTGLGGETHRGVYFPSARDLDRPGSARRGRDLILDLFAAGSALRRPVRDLLAAEIDGVDGLEDRLSLSEWLSRFHWRFRENCRGNDTLDRADLSSWTWAPLMDVGLLAVSRDVSAASRSSNRLIEAATLRLAPQLASVGYDRTVARRPPEWLRRWVVRRGLLGLARRARARVQGERRPIRSAERLAAQSILWDELYFGRADHVWPALIDEARLRQAVREDPDGALVKALAVPELLLRNLDDVAT